MPTARDATYEDKQTLPQRLLNSDLFPESRFLIYNNYFPLKVTCDNFAITCHTTEVVLSGNEVLRAVSFSSYMMNPNGHSLAVFFHGNTEGDLLAHLKFHIERHKSNYASSNGKLRLETIFPMTLPTEKVKKSLFLFLGINTLYEDAPREAVVVVECPLPILKANM